MVKTANGEVQTHEDPTVYVKELVIFLTVKFLEHTSAILSLGKLCEDYGYSYEWISGQKSCLIENDIRIRCNTENFVSIVVHGLSMTSSPSSSSASKLPILSVKKSTNLIPNPTSIECDCEDRQARGTRCTIQPNPKNPMQKCWPWVSEGVTPYIPKYQYDYKNSERILWMKESLNLETSTRVLLMSYLQSRREKWHRMNTVFASNCRKFEIARSVRGPKLQGSLTEDALVKDLEQKILVTW